MAILDAKYELSDAQSVMLLTAGSIGSTNVINLGTGYDEWGSTKYNDIGEGGDLWLNIMVNTALAPQSAVLKITLQGASSATTAKASTGATSFGEWTITGDATTKNFAAGRALVRTKVPSGIDKQYLALLYEEKSGNTSSILTAGAVDAWIGNAVDSRFPYA